MRAWSYNLAIRIRTVDIVDIGCAVYVGIHLPPSPYLSSYLAFHMPIFLRVWMGARGLVFLWSSSGLLLVFFSPFLDC